MTRGHGPPHPVHPFLPLAAAPCRVGGASAAGLQRATIPFSSMSRFDLLQIDVEVVEPETTENPTQSFVIHNNVWRRTQILAVIIYIIDKDIYI